MTRKYMKQREKGSEERGSKGCALSVAEKQGGSVLSVQMVFFLKVTDMMVERRGEENTIWWCDPRHSHIHFFKKRPYSPYLHLPSSVPPTFQLFKKGLLNVSFLNQE